MPDMMKKMVEKKMMLKAMPKRKKLAPMPDKEAMKRLSISKMPRKMRKMTTEEIVRNRERARKIRKRTSTAAMGERVIREHKGRSYPWITDVVANEESMVSNLRGQLAREKETPKKRKIKRVKRGPEPD